jgi:hypothetical protein
MPFSERQVDGRRGFFERPPNAGVNLVTRLCMRMQKSTPVSPTPSLASALTGHVRTVTPLAATDMGRAPGATSVE